MAWGFFVWSGQLRAGGRWGTAAVEHAGSSIVTHVLKRSPMDVISPAKNM